MVTHDNDLAGEFKGGGAGSGRPARNDHGVGHLEKNI